MLLQSYHSNLHWYQWDIKIKVITIIIHINEFDITQHKQLGCAYTTDKYSQYYINKQHYVTNLLRILLSSVFIFKHGQTIALYMHFLRDKNSRGYIDSTIYYRYRQICTISRTLLGNKLGDHSDVIGASPVGAFPTASSYLSYHLASRDLAKATTRWDENNLRFGLNIFISPQLGYSYTTIHPLLWGLQQITHTHNSTHNKRDHDHNYTD